MHSLAKLTHSHSASLRSRNLSTLGHHKQNQKESPMDSKVVVVDLWRGLRLRQNNFALGLQASLTHSLAKLTHSHSASLRSRNLSTLRHHKQNQKESPMDSPFDFGRSGGTRTRGLQYPKLARYHLRYTSLFNSLNIPQFYQIVNTFNKIMTQNKSRRLRACSFI